MKKFETPVVEFVAFAAEDVVTTSDPCPTYNPDCGTDLGEF